METENNNSNGMTPEMQHIIDDQLEAIETAKGKLNKQSAKDKLEEVKEKGKESLLDKIKQLLGL